MKKIALSVASALLIVMVSGAVVTANASAVQQEGGSSTSQGLRPLTNGWN